MKSKMLLVNRSTINLLNKWLRIRHNPGLPAQADTGNNPELGMR
jgi:hypothetical protein